MHPRYERRQRRFGLRAVDAEVVCTRQEPRNHSRASRRMGPRIRITFRLKKRNGRELSRGRFPAGVLLRFHNLEEHVFLRMRLAGNRIQRIHRLHDGVPGVAPKHIHVAIR